MKNILILLIISFYSSFAFSAETDFYKFNWLDGEKVYVIQNKEFKKAKKVSLSLGYATSYGTTYQSISAFKFSGNYFISETFSISGQYNLYNSEDSEEMTVLINDVGTKPLVRKLSSSVMLYVNWLPFYGKINTFNRIFYFDFGVGLGYGNLSYEANNETFLFQNQEIAFTENSTSVYGIRTFTDFYLSRYVLSLEYNLSFYDGVNDAAGSTKSLSYTDISVSFGVLF